MRRAAAALLLALAWPALPASPAEAAPARPWRAEFDAVCARTQDAMGLGDAELRELVARCDALLPGLAKLEASERKVFTRRLSACRNLYQFVLDAREKR